MESAGERLVHAIASRDEDGVRALLTDHVDFKGLTPRRFWEGSSPGEVLDVVLGHWFEESDQVDEVQAISTDQVADTEHVTYRFAITNPDGTHVVEQQAYYRTDGDRIGYLRVLCSGFRPVD